jgi:hypothetical protein
MSARTFSLGERQARRGADDSDNFVTINDPKAYTAPWGARETMQYLPDSELIEHICEENDKFPDQIAPH